MYNATSKPSVVVLSDQELFVTWQRPACLLGRLIRYELIVNGEKVYSGTDTKYTIKSLTGGEMYDIMVSFIVIPLFYGVVFKTGCSCLNRGNM